jgi:hypothetical protein
VPWTDDETLGLVRPQVREILEASPAFSQLSDAEKKEIATTMVKVGAYMANPDGLAAEALKQKPSQPPAAQAPLARAQADAVEATKQRLAGKQGFAGKDFEAGAVKQGVKQFGELVKKVDFPKFVGGLIKNVFQAIVESSIDQMRAYGELLANVAKTVDQFAQDNITENNARDWLAGRFPGLLEVQTGEGSSSFAEGSEAPAAQARLVPKGDDPEAVAKTVSDSLQLEKPISDISDEAEEQRLVLAARLQIARSRQQLLASMVVLGINRIVITDGLIHAKVIFDMRASDMAARRASASMLDAEKQHFGMKAEASYGSWYTPYDASVGTEYSTDHMATVQSSVDETSESKAEVKAKLSGEVRVNFKSDYFPMEKLASPEMIAAIQGNAKPAEKSAAVA